MEEDEIEENILHYDTKYDAICQEIYLEYPILQKILYRNANQHGNTVVYQYLRVIAKSMKNLTRDRMQLMNTCVKEALKYNLNMKVTAIEVEKLLAALQLAQLVVDEISKIIHYCLKAATILQIQLAKRFFVGFYGLLYGMLAKIADGFIQLITRFHSDFTSILELIKHYAIVNQKVSDLISTRLKSIQLDPQTNGLVSRLKGKPIQSISEFIPPTQENISKSTSSAHPIEDKELERGTIPEKNIEEQEEVEGNGGEDEDLGFSTKPILSNPSKVSKPIFSNTIKLKSSESDKATIKKTPKQSTLTTSESSPALNIIKVKTPNKRKLFSPESFQVSPSLSQHQVPAAPVFPPEKKMKIDKQIQPEKKIPAKNDKTSDTHTSISSTNKNNSNKKKKPLDDIDAIFSGLF